MGSAARAPPITPLTDSTLPTKKINNLDLRVTIRIALEKSYPRIKVRLPSQRLYQRRWRSYQSSRIAQHINAFELAKLPPSATNEIRSNENSFLFNGVSHYRVVETKLDISST